MMTAPLVLVAGLLLSTAVHYTDNWLSIEDYAPETGILADNPGLIPVAWVLFAAVGIAAYLDYRRAPSTRAHLLLAVFSVAGISSFGHLYYEGNDWDLYQWAFVLTDGLFGSAVLAFALWSAANRRTPALSTRKRPA